MRWLGGGCLCFFNALKLDLYSEIWRLCMILLKLAYLLRSFIDLQLLEFIINKFILTSLWVVKARFIGCLTRASFL